MDNRAGTVGSYEVGSRNSHPGVRTESVPPVGSIPTGTFPTPRLPYQAPGRAYGADDDWAYLGRPRLPVRNPRFLMAVHIACPASVEHRRSPAKRASTSGREATAPTRFVRCNALFDGTPLVSQVFGLQASAF